MTEDRSRRKFILTSAAAGALLGGGVVTLEGCSVDWITTAIADLPTIINIATTVLEIVADALGQSALSPAIAAIINTAATAAKATLVLVQALVQNYQSNPSASVLAQIKADLLTVQSQLGSILAAAHIDNPALQAAITTGVALAIGTVDLILSLLPSSNIAGAFQAQKKAQQGWITKPYEATNITNQFNAFLTDNGYGKYAH
jgi:hypothetical protein